ncbi:MAG: hypothetical protein ACR2IS_00265 [Nitrososphaeraceae archaeon]
MKNRQQFEITPHQREQMVIDYISEHQGCTKADITRGLENEISKKTIDKIVGEMIDDDIIETKKENPNSRNIKLFLKESNLLVSIPKQLEQFDNSFTILVDKTGQKIMLSEIGIPISKAAGIPIDSSLRLSPQQIFQLLNIKLSVFYRVIDSILLQSLIVWPKKIEDKETLKKLYVNAFSKIADIMIKFSEQHIDAIFWNISLESQIINRFHGASALVDFQEIYGNIGMKQEIDSVLNSLWNIDKDIRHLVYKEKEYLGIDFKEDDGWRKLLILVKDKMEKAKR